MASFRDYPELRFAIDPRSSAVSVTFTTERAQLCTLVFGFADAFQAHADEEAQGPIIDLEATVLDDADPRVRAK